MNDVEKFELAREGLKFCPECGEALTPNPRNVIMVGCVNHGDFMLLWVEGDLYVRWRAVRMAPAYEDKSAYIVLNPEAIQDIIGQRYLRGEITFIEACKMIAVAQGKPFPDDPSSEDLMVGHTILDDYTTGQASIFRP